MTTSFSVSSCRPEDIEFVWEQVQPHIERALRHGEGNTVTLGMLKHALLTADMTLWAVHSGNEVIAAIVHRIIQHHPRCKRLFVVIVAGRDIDMWADEVEQMLIDYKDVMGCDTLECSCRHGMARYLEKRGWKKQAIIMRAPEQGRLR